jgi:CRP-like cAMP-binding protein
MDAANFFSHLQPFATTQGARAELLDKTNWAHDFHYKEIEAVSAYTESYKAAKGTIVVVEGARESYMGIVIAGRLDVKKKAGAAKVIAQLGPGKTFGEMSIIDGEPRSASIVAADHATLLVITKAHIERLGEKDAKLALKFVFKIARILSQRLRQTSGLLADHLDIES